jgi:hypothetical protein
MTKIKIIELDELYNFVVADFFIWNHLVSKISVRSSYILKFKFWVVITKSYGEMTNTKNVDLNEFYNFVFDNFSIWKTMCAMLKSVHFKKYT